VAVALVYGATTTTKKIRSSKKDLSAVTTQKKKASRHLGKIAKDIQKAEKDIDFLDKKIDELSKDQNKTEEKYISLKIELKKSTQDFKQTSKELEQKRKKFISLLSEQFSITFAMEQAHAPTRKSIMAQEVYKAYKKQNIKMLEALKSDIRKLKKRKKINCTCVTEHRIKLKELLKNETIMPKRKSRKRSY
jgi:chromosome segregation ATPase